MEEQASKSHPAVPNINNTKCQQLATAIKIELANTSLLAILMDSNLHTKKNPDQEKEV